MKVQVLESSLYSPIKVSVVDTGCGIPADKQEQLFKAFGQLKFKKRINDGGAGIGLTFCRKVAELIDAKIAFTTEIGVGTTFTLVFQNVDSDERYSSISNISLNLMSPINTTKQNMSLEKFLPSF